MRRVGCTLPGHESSFFWGVFPNLRLTDYPQFTMHLIDLRESSNGNLQTAK